MALQRAAQLFLVNSEVVDTGTGVNVNALSDVEAGATDGTQSVLNSTQNSVSERTWRPGLAGITAAENASTQNLGKGWAVPTAGMATDSACVPIIPAQTVLVRSSGTATGTGAGNVGANDIAAFRASLWKWNTSTNTATLIHGVAASTGITISAVLAYGPTSWVTTSASGDVTLTVPAGTTFAANEILMLVVGAQISCGAGLLGGARTTTWVLNVDVSTTWMNCNTSGLRQSCSKSFTASTTPSGAIVKTPIKVLASATTPSSVLKRIPSRSLAGLTTPSATLNKLLNRLLSASSTPSGALIKSPVKQLSGTITPGPSSIIKVPAKLLLSSITPVSTVTKLLSRALVGSTTPTGQVFKRPSKYFLSTLTPGPGSLIRTPVKLLQSTITPGPSIVRTLLTKNFRSDLPMSGALRKEVSKYFTGSTTPTGSLTKRITKYLTGVISGEGGGSIIRRIRRVIVDD